MSYLPIVLLALAHALIDTFALLIQPLWPDLQRSLALTGGQIQWIYIFWSLISSASQLLFGYIGDRIHGRWMVWGAPVVAVLCLSAIGSATTAFQLCLLLLLGGLAVGAFHPEAAAMVGASASKHRSRAMSIFVLGGSLGQAIGPAYSGMVTTQFGLGALLWSAPWGVVFVVLLAIGLRKLPQTTPVTMAWSGGAAEKASLRKGTILLVLIIGILRVIPAMGILLALAFMLKSRGMRNEDIGWAQGVFQISAGAGVFACALLVRRTHERLVLWLVPLFALPALWFCAFANYSGLLASLAICGLALGGATPVLISYAQTIIPHAQRLASSITMGVSWGIGGAVVAAMVTYFDGLGHPEWSFLAMIPAALASSLLCIWLPSQEGRQRVVLPPTPVDAPAVS